MVMKRLFIFLALFVAVGSIQAVEVVLTDVSDQEIARIEHDVLKSEMINSNLVDEGDTEVRVPVPNQTFALVTKVVELANSQYKLPVNLGRPQLIELIKIADHLNIRPLLNTAFGQLLTNKEAANWWGTGELNSLGSLLDTTFSTIFRMENDKPDYSLINRFVSPLPIGEELTDVAWVDIAPDSSYYWVRFRDGRVQMYGRDGVLIGEELTDVAWVDIAPDSSYYWVQFMDDNRAQMYGRDGVLIGEGLTDVGTITIAPDSSYYWVHFRDDNGAQMYGRDGALIGEGLTDVWNVFIAPDSSYYWVHFRDGRVQMYGRDGVLIGEELTDVAWINIAPDSSYYWVRFRDDNRAQMYGRNGVLIGEELTYVRNVFIAPDSSYYWVHFMDDNGAQMYGRNGALIGEELTDVWNVFIAPDSSYFWVKYRVGRVQLYSRKYNQTVEQSLFLRSIFNGKKHYNISKDSSLYERIFAKLPQTVRNELRDADQVTITNEETG